ncbi:MULTISPECIES: phosphomannomutase/phosphoglucomutase [unclassified Acinetobacter]|uniref:phosphomannomutase/phosphoglucomutase n=1 Tax=unclassified Acinetobacter TaxID=196816 RepID=UPI0035B89760
MSESVVSFNQTIRLRPEQRKIFRAYDIRGQVSVLDEILITQIAHALAQTYLEQQQSCVVIGFDARLSSKNYAELMARIFAEQGLDVVEIGCVSSPMLYFTASQYQGNGVMITASHNPISDNGIKWLVQGFAPTAEQIQQLADKIESLDILDFPYQKNTKIANQSRQAEQLYLNYLQQDIQPNHKFILHVFLDGLNGSAGKLAEQALQQLAYDFTAFNTNANGHFPNGSPDPSNAERLLTLQHAIIQAKHHSDQHCLDEHFVGMVLDGDGDRVVLVDEYGKVVSPDRLLCLLAKIVLQQEIKSPYKKEILCDVKCSTLLAKVAEKHGATLRMIRTGSSFLRNDLQRSHACFGGEFAGHYVFNDGRGCGFDDGLYVALRVFEYLQQHHLSLSQALAEFPEHLATEDIYIDNQDIDFHQVITTLKDKAAHQSDVDCCEIDGIRLDFAHGFGLLRASNTGDYLTLRFDAEHEQAMQQIQQFFIDSLADNSTNLVQRIQQKLMI